MKSTLSLAVTGGAGQIAYSLLFRIANGDLFGKDQPIDLRILEVPEALSALQGVKMELDDCAFPLLEKVTIGSDPYKIFEGIDWAILIGSKPRGPGMERKELLSENGKIFVGQGQALNSVAKRDAKVFVVGNPCNTNCLICMHNAPNLKRENFFAMTRLDENRAKALLSAKSDRPVTEVSQMAIWGNHSSTQVPDFVHAKIGGKQVLDVINDPLWLQATFIQSVQQRGAEIIKARGKSSAASAASAVIDSIRSMLQPTAQNDWFSLAISSHGNPYGIDEELIFSFPCRIKQPGVIETVQGLRWDTFLEEKIKATEKELKEERELVLHYVS